MECKLPNKCYCKACRKIYDAKYYQTIKPQRKTYVKNRVKELQKWARDLKDKPCTDCNNKFHFASMQYDHINDDKLFNVSRMVVGGFSKSFILEEIAKCELVCANCHAVRTYNRHFK